VIEVETMRHYKRVSNPDRNLRAHITCSSTIICHKWSQYSKNFESIDISGHRRFLRHNATINDSLPTTSPPPSTQHHQQHPQPSSNQDADTAELESLQLLEWPELCATISRFAQTSFGAEAILAGHLPIGSSQQESERLLLETKEAQAADLDFKGVYDVRKAVEAASESKVLLSLVLAAILSTLQATQRIITTLNTDNNSSSNGTSALVSIVKQYLGDGLQTLSSEIARCIRSEDGYILDAASPRLSEARTLRRQNSLQLRKLMEEWARDLHATGACERSQVVIRRDRLCLPVKAPRKSSLPKGSVALATSASGNTIYMEPAPLIPMNNAEAALAAQEQEEEVRVLRMLSGLVGRECGRLNDVMEGLKVLDVACARGRYSAWLGGVTPTFTDNSNDNGMVIDVSRVRHPLLLGRTLLPPPNPPAPEFRITSGAAVGTDFGLLSSRNNNNNKGKGKGGSFAEEGGLRLVPELAAMAAFNQAAASPSSSDDEGVSSSLLSSSLLSSTKPPPVAIDLVVPWSTRVIAVTGPNTGGKTASLKTLGLTCLMAKAGLFPAVQQIEEEKEQKAVLVWFDKILADIGDSQSLQQSLSTFSGHIRRINRALAAATSQSLVLLDEVGSGTDPQEGAALACAVLLKLSKTARLTYATSHHSQVKKLAEGEASFVNASVEFNIATLKPTYRLMWGVAGDSNALSVAQGLGFSPPVVAEARGLVEGLRASGGAGSAERAKALRESLTEELRAAVKSAGTAAKAREQAEQLLAVSTNRLEALQKELQSAKKQGGDTNNRKQKSSSKQQQQSLPASSIAAVDKIKQIVSDAKAGTITFQQAETGLREIERTEGDAGAAALKLYGLRTTSSLDDLPPPPMAGASSSDSDSDYDAYFNDYTAISSWSPKEGDMVRVAKIGGAIGTVTAINSANRITVKVGAMMVSLKPTEVLPLMNNTTTKKNKKKKNKAYIPSISGSGEKYGAVDGVKIQTTRNTLDVRGMYADDAAGEVRERITGAGPGEVLFIVHGVGTGKVRAAVRECIKGNKKVKEWEEEEGSQGGCTVVTVK